MLKFKEFISEATERMTKDKWQAAYDSIKGTKTTTEFFKAVKDMYGFSTDSQKDYYKASKAFKDIVAGGGTAKATPKATPAPKSAPVAKPVVAPKPAAAKPAPKPVAGPKFNFDTSSLVKKYKQLSSLINEIESETNVLVREYAKLRNNQHMNNLETPDLYNLYLTIESLRYTQPLHKEISNKLRNAGTLAADAARYEKSRK
ncbi:hypothetical protein KNT65_gp149 [Escherichia phage EcS1]|uniref:Uncharacterized protein n=1 Tax=Escherichia phage EcS1 TaxID=2083276 RepID=A0A2Z5ZCJ0_9CAUD|nr:hypothetical protein KNT65_gp149 [Escherichia phage EcS1]BBC78197.1 hypothetical protein [Escherichia phage EcS1]